MFCPFDLYAIGRTNTVFFFTWFGLHGHHNFPIFYKFVICINSEVFLVTRLKYPYLLPLCFFTGELLTYFYWFLVVWLTDYWPCRRALNHGLKPWFQVFLGL